MSRRGKIFDQDLADLPPSAAPPSRTAQAARVRNSTTYPPRRPPPVASRPAAPPPDPRTAPVRRAAVSASTPPRPGPRDRVTRPMGAGDQAPGFTPQTTGQATAILAAGTFASRVTGFARVLAIGYVLGVSSLSDAFNYANGVPNIVYDLLLGGILSATLIPVFVEYMGAKSHREGARAISAVVTAIAAALVVMTALLWIAAPLVIHFYLLLNPKSTGGAERALATELLRYFAPQVFFLGAIVVSTALLNARRSFTAPAFSPVLNNLIAIAALLVTKFVASNVLTSTTASADATLLRFRHDERAVLILGIGITAGYVAQFLVQLPAMRRAGIHLRLVWDLRHPAVRRVAALSSWLIGVVLANQVSLALVMVLAGRVQGGVTAYQFSYQFFQLPYALIAVSIATAIMPDLAERWTAKDRRGFEQQFVAGLKLTLALLIPMGLVYVAVAQPFIQLAIHHGRVSQSGAHLVSSTLAVFAAGLPGFSAFFLLMRAYQAMQNARKMFWIYALENAMTVVAALILDPLIGVPGLALAWVGPYTIASVIAAADLRKRVGPLGGARTVRTLVRVSVASLITLGVVVLIGLPFSGKEGDVAIIGRLILQVGAAVIVYAGLARVMRINELRAAARMARQVVHPGQVSQPSRPTRR